MRKLLSANFSRLWRSKIFWVLEALSAIAGAVFYILAIINTKNIGENWYLASGNYYFFIGLVIAGAIMAVFSAFYIGLEYAIPQEQVPPTSIHQGMVSQQQQMPQYA